MLPRYLLLFICLMNVTPILAGETTIVKELGHVPTLTLQQGVNSDDFTANDPIMIRSNEELLSWGFPGSGTPSDPVIIANYMINKSATHLIDIRNTNLYVTIMNNLLDGIDSQSEFYGLNIELASNVEIINNTMQLTDKAINVYKSTNISILQNIILETKQGIHVSSSNLKYGKNLLIVANTITTSILDKYCISVTYIENITISRNNISSRSYGMYVLAKDLTIDNNILRRTTTYGLRVGGTNATVSNNYIQQDGVVGPGAYGLWIEASSIDMDILNNTITGSRYAGVTIDKNVRDVQVLHNIISENLHGLRIINAYEIIVCWNDFINNSYMIHEPQVQETFLQGTASSNIICFNHYDDWVNDSDGDGFADSPYLAGGNANNSDRFPLAHPNPAGSFKCLKPEFLITADSIEVHGNIEIGWRPALASIDCEINYDLLYSFNNSSTWELFASGLERPLYNWNTSELAPGNYTVKIRTSFNHGGNITTIETVVRTVYMRVALTTDQSESSPWTGDELRDTIYLLIQAAFVILTITVIFGLGILVNSIRNRLYEKAEKDFYLKSSGQAVDHSMDGVAFDEYLDRILPSDDSDK